MPLEKKDFDDIYVSAIYELMSHPSNKSWDFVQKGRQLIMKIKEELGNDIPVWIVQFIRIFETVIESANSLEESISKQNLLQSIPLGLEYISGGLQQEEVVNADVPEKNPSEIQLVAVAEASSGKIQASEDVTIRLKQNAQQSSLKLETHSFQSNESEDEREEKMKRKNNDLFASSPNKKRRFSLEDDDDGLSYNKTSNADADTDEEEYKFLEEDRQDILMDIEFERETIW